METRLDGFNRKRRHKPFTRIDGGVGDVAEGGYRHDFQSRKTELNPFDCVTKSAHVDGLSGAIDVREPLGRARKVQTFLESRYRTQASFDIAFKLPVIKLH